MKKTITWLPVSRRDHTKRPTENRIPYPLLHSDFRLGDPCLLVDNDPKTFIYDEKDYNMPWESTVCISQRWFYNTTDTTFKSIDEQEKLYRQYTKNDNILILNCQPNEMAK